MTIFENIIFMLTTKKKYDMINISKKTTQFLLKIMKGKNMKKLSVLNFVNDALLVWNLEKYPNPEFLGINEILGKYGKLLNWRKIANWSEKKLVRTKKVKFLFPTNNTLFDENDPVHVKKGWHEKDYYAKEDFQILVEKDVLLNQLNLKIKEVETKDGNIGIYRDFTKTLPDLTEIRNMADSMNTFTVYLANKKLKEKLADQNFTPEEVAKFTDFLNNLVPFAENI